MKESKFIAIKIIDIKKVGELATSTWQPQK